MRIKRLLCKEGCDANGGSEQHDYRNFLLHPSFFGILQSNMQAFKRYTLKPEERATVISDIAAFLDKEEAILFAYVYGSFCDEDGFNDIDVAVYVDEAAITKDDRLDYQLGITVRLERELKLYTIDGRILNNAPLSFRFSVITHGDIIYAKDEKTRVSFEAMTRSLYFDFKPHAQFYYQYLVAGA